MSGRPRRSIEIFVTIKVACLWSLMWCILPTTHATAYAFRDVSGQLHWANSPRPVTGSTGAPAFVLSTPATPDGVLDSQRAITTKAPNARTSRVLPLVLSAASRHHLDPALLLALIEVESSFNNAAVSPKGARGLMQLMPATARRYGLRRTLDLHDPALNIDLGARHLRDLLAAHQGNLAIALASYNAGQPAVKRHGGAIPAFRETMLYVPAILTRMQVYRALTPLESPHASLRN